MHVPRARFQAAGAFPATHKVEKQGLAVCKQGYEAVTVELADLWGRYGKSACGWVSGAWKTNTWELWQPHKGRLPT